MFRIESYITSIILSYVDRYIKNFRQQDAQVSLWEGDGSFQNLNLDLEVLEEELNLPFSFVSGHIHELLIHVPWTRLTSEPVQITINTIECVMKLKPAGSHQPHARHSRRSIHAMEDPQSQSSLVSSLVNKIICNVSVTCNNLILKYVEEDIVLSMNIKTLSFGTVNNKWEPAFMELNSSQLELRKLISLSDVTVCLDKRNASGRIESYLEPLLYRCFITIRLCQSYMSANAKRAFCTRLDVFCERMAFTVSEPQLPMLLRLMSLCLALHRKQFSQTSLHSAPADDAAGDKEDTDEGESAGNPEESWSSWSTWAFGWMPTLIPLVDEGDENDPYQESLPPVSIFNFGFYVDTFTLALKLCELEPSGGMKTQSQAFMHLLLKGCRMDLLSHNANWTNVQMGICQATVKPDGDCCCGVSELSQLVYLSSGSMLDGFLSGSLFDKEPSRLQDRLGHSWKYHLESISEAIMLEKSPAFAVDYLSCTQDKFEESEEEESDDEDTERLPAKEKVVIRYVAGPVVIRVCSGLIHRVQMLMKACANYDYVPYTTNTTLPPAQDNQVLDLVHRLSEKSVEMDEDLYSRYLPIHTAQFTAFNTIVELYPANHLPVHYATLGRKLSRSQRRAASGGAMPPSPPPCVTLECQCAYATLTRPLYPDKILLMASKFHRDKLPPEIINTSLSRLAFKAVGVSSSLRLPFLQAMKVVETSSVSSEQSWHSLITPLDECVGSDIGVHIENITMTSSKAKLMLLCEIISSLIATNNRQRYLAAYKTIYNTSLLHDAATTTDTIYLKLVVEHVKLRRAVAALYSSVCVSVMACQLFAVRLPDKGDEWETMIVAAPDTDTPVTAPLLEITHQQPVSLNQFPPVLTFTLREVRFSADPLLYSWLLYTPTVSFPAHQSTLMSHKSTDSMKSRKVSESSLSSYMRRAPTPTPLESAPSSSERETHPSSQPLGGLDTVPVVPLPDRVATLYPQWKTMIVYGDVSQVSIYLPQSSLASTSPLTMEEGLQAALRQSNPLLQVLVIKLPSMSLRCTNHKQGLQQFTDHMPIKLPHHLWNVDKDNFPWTVSIADLHCYTLHGQTSLPLLKPVSFNCTIGTSPKLNDRNILISLALCVHLDTTPVNINISEEQVVLIVSLLMAQMKVFDVLMPVWYAEAAPADTSNLKLISSDESSNISQSDDLARSGGPVKVKLTGWLQWTLVRTTVKMYSKPSRESPDELKLALDVEDIILSLDVERVYHKVKFKVATASVCHYTRTSGAESWRRGAFHGLVMRGYDPDGFTVKHSADESQAPAGFLMATVTRAKCNNFHSRLGSPTKYPALCKKSLKSEKFITEIEIKMQPLDFVLSPTTLGMFVQVLDPLLCLVQAPPHSGGGGGQKHSAPLHSSALPLLYLDLMTIRVVLPTSTRSAAQPDVLVIQFDSMTANPHPENPLCRTPLRPDIYHKGEKQRILNIPGSELEDRQYQFNLTCLRVQTGMWCDLEEVFVREVAVTSQHQNPALDWNEGRSPMFQVPAHQLMATLVHSFNLAVVVAPAMFYLDKDIVCGHAAEVNATSDVSMSVTLDQLTLCGTLASELVSVLRLTTHRQPRAPAAPAMAPATPRPGARPNLSLPEHDSGVESADGTSSHLKQVDPNLPAVHAVSPSGFSQVSGCVQSSLPSTIYPTTLVWPSKRSVVPCEVLITGSAVVLSVFAVDHQEQLTYEPLFHTHISQPHTFICRNTDNIITCQMSAFDLGVRCGVVGHSVSCLSGGAKPFPQPLVETRSGEPHPLTGIPPSALTVKVAWDNDKPPKIDFDMGRPLRIICTLEIIEYLKRLRGLVFLSLFEPFNRCPDASSGVTIQVREVSAGDDSDHYLRKLLKRFTKFTAKTKQIVLIVKSSTQEVDGCAELCLSVGGCQGQVTSSLSLQHALSADFHLDTVTVSTRKITSPKVRLLLNPWQLTVHANLSWDSWLTSADPPTVSVSADSDVLSLQLSPEQLVCLQALWADYCPLLTSRAMTDEKPVLSRANSCGDSSGEEQHYHDDLQAGAFQFVDGGSGGGERSRDEPPLTYQVAFWASPPQVMAWRYPQPRAITKFKVMPIPFKDTAEDGATASEPTCTLQYYSEAQGCYADHASFTLSQTTARAVELPHQPPVVVATTWRVVLHSGGTAVPIKALAASIRVDSYFSPALIPAVQIAVNLTAVQLSLWTSTDSYLPLPEPLDRYYLDRRFPEEHDFFTAVLEQANVTYSIWPKVGQQVRVKGRVRVDVLNYHTLSSQCCLPPCPVVATGYTTPDCRQYSLVTGHCHVRLGPALSHSLAASLATWLPSQQPHTQALLTPYVVCNNTCMPLRFRQAGSDEYIPLQVFQCHLYSWRTTKHPMKMEFGLLEPEDNDWSKSLSLRAGSSSVIKMSTSSQEYAFVVSVKRLTTTVCQVVINGQLSLYNKLSVPLEVRMIPEGDGQQQSSLVVVPGSSPPSVVLDPRHNLNLRVRFSSFPAPWSGDIPLRPAAKQSKQWEVKLPLKDRGQFRSVWCHVIFDMVEDIYQMLVVFSPLYTIKSLLPCAATAVVETPALGCSQTVPISGRGATQHLDTPGLSDDKHNITFQLDCKVPASSPPVSLHYHMLDGALPPPPPHTDVAALLGRLQGPALDNTPAWPYLGAVWAGVEWLSTTQPDTLTQVRVKFSDDVIASNTLLVEVQPWALLVNTLGSHVYLQGKERTLCSLAHRTVISPPPLESTFQVGVELENVIQLSDPIQLKRGPGFEMPHIPGLLPPCGFINTTLTGKYSVCFMNVTSSEVSMSNLRLIHVRSSYVIASLSKQDLIVSAIAVKAADHQYTLSEEMLKYSVTVRSQSKSSKLKCQPLTEWRVLGALEGEGELFPHLVVQAGEGGSVSCPARLPGGLERHSVPIIFPAATEDTLREMLVMTVEQVDGQTHLLLWDQPHPQLTVHNHTSSVVIFAKAKTDNGGGFEPDCEHIKWRMMIPAGESAHYNFPNTDESPPQSLPAAVIAVLSTQTNEPKWSDPVVLTQCQGRLLSLLGLPDVTLAVTRRGHTTHVTLSTASHTEILAVDIRGQLSRQLLSERRLSNLSHSSGEDRQELNTDQESTAPPSFPPSEPGTGEGRGLEVSCYVHGLTATLLSQSEQGCECREVAALTVDHVGITVHPHPHQDLSVREMKVHTTVGDIQLDNQEFSSGGYDFPVVLLMQKPRDAHASVVSMSQHARTLVDKARTKGSAADLTVVVDVNSHANIVVQDVSIKLAPLQIYIEDKYIFHLKECFMNTLPLPLSVETAPKSSVNKTIYTSTHKNDIELRSKDQPKAEENDSAEVPTDNNVKNDLNEGAEEEDLFNVSEPEDNQSPEDATTAEVAASDNKTNISNFETDSPWTVQATSSSLKHPIEQPAESVGFPIPPEVLSASRDLARPLRLRSLSISELDLLVSIHTSTKFYIALDHSPLQLAAFKRSSLFTTAYRLGHSLSLHYFFGAIYGTGWALGSLELLGAPGGLARSLGLGLRDFISLPLQGMLLGPQAFFIGIAHGSASLMQHFAAGTITSVTRLAASWARTLDRLTLDTRDLERSEQLRRLRPQNLTQGVVQGLTEFGISLIGAVSSIAHHPLQYVMSERPDRGLVSSVGLGLVGVFTRPLSGVAELVALTGEGLLSGVGWTNVPRVRHEPVTQHNQCGSDSRLKYQWKLLLPTEQLLIVSEATSDCYEAVTLLVTTGSLYVVNSELDIVTRAVRLAELQVVTSDDDPTLVAFRVQPAKEQALLLSQSRILEYVRESQRMLIGELSNISPSTTPTADPEEPHFQFFVNPQVRNHFLAVLQFATRHAVNRGFSVIS